MNFYLSKDRTNSALTRSEKSDRMVITLRPAEILSMVELSALVFASGEATAIRRRAVAELKTWAEEQAARPLTRRVSKLTAGEDVMAYWARLKGQQDLCRFGVPVMVV
jgi:hypothetical protein